MRRMTFLLVSAALLVSCASTVPSSRAEECATLMVSNHNFADVVVSLDVPRRRLGVVTGLTTETLKICGPIQVRSVLHLHAIGGAFDGTVSGVGSQYIYPRSGWRLVIEGSVWGSYLTESLRGG